MGLTKDDYVKILKFYKMKIPETSQQIKDEATKILQEKLCRCIKKVDPLNESRSIAICTKSIFGRKGLTRGKFKCKGKKTRRKK